MVYHILKYLSYGYGIQGRRHLIKASKFVSMPAIFGLYCSTYFYNLYLGGGGILLVYYENSSI